MAKLQRKSISRRTVEALSVEKDTVFWDSELPGFGVRVYPSGGKVYIAQTRARGESKRVTVGRHCVLTAAQARQRAAMIIARVKAGEDPVPAPIAPEPPSGPMVAGIAAEYLGRARRRALQAKHGSAAPFRARSYLTESKRIPKALGL